MHNAREDVLCALLTPQSTTPRRIEPHSCGAALPCASAVSVAAMGKRDAALEAVSGSVGSVLALLATYPLKVGAGGS